MKISLSFLIVCLACLACNDAVDLTSISKDLGNRNPIVAPQDIVISPYDPYRWTRLPDFNTQVLADMYTATHTVFTLNSNAYCHRVFRKVGTNQVERRTYKLNKSTKQWEIYGIDLTQFFQDFDYLFSFRQYVYGIAGDKRVGRIDINTGQFRSMASFPGVSPHYVTAVAIGSDG